MSMWWDVRSSMESGRNPHVESFDDWLDEEEVNQEEDEFDNQELGPE